MAQCPIFYTRPPECSVTYAENLGSKYDSFQIIYASFTVLMVRFLLPRPFVIPCPSAVFAPFLPDD